jgi:hypothetical protein
MTVMVMVTVMVIVMVKVGASMALLWKDINPLVAAEMIAIATRPGPEALIAALIPSSAPPLLLVSSQLGGHRATMAREAVGALFTTPSL